MAERAKKGARATRLPSPLTGRQGDLLPTIDLSALNRPQLEAIATERGLSTGGTDTQLRTRITTDVTTAYTNAGS